MSSPFLPLDRITPLTQAQFADSFGVILASVMLPLFGLSVIQAYLYYLNYGKDPRLLKAFVAFIWTLGAVHALMVCHTGYYYLVLSYTNPLSLVQGEWSVFTANAVSIFSCFIIEIYFAGMLFRLTKGRWRIFIATVYVRNFDTAQIAFGILVTYKLFTLWEFSKLHVIIYREMVPMFLLRVVTDAFTALALCIVLYDTRTHFNTSQSLIRTLIVYAINRFILTTVVLIAQVIFLILKPQSLGAMSMEFVTAHLYINSFLATLNTRASLRKSEGVMEMNDDSFKVASRRRTVLGTPRESHEGVKIDSETFVLADNARNAPTKSSTEDDFLSTAKIHPV
ncbi:hypothetical protein K438DRAFT_1965843 [Mycena galopus ATCC 62051]|nr:hypothetical protein K438DRAFT_1965843 [Mycena galopus ATCC 62051]